MTIEEQATLDDLVRQRNEMATRVTLMGELLKAYVREHCGGKQRSEGKACIRCKQAAEIIGGGKTVI